MYCIIPVPALSSQDRRPCCFFFKYCSIIRSSCWTTAQVHLCGNVRQQYAQCVGISRRNPQKFTTSCNSLQTSNTIQPDPISFTPWYRSSLPWNKKSSRTSHECSPYEEADSSQRPQSFCPQTALPRSEETIHPVASRSLPYPHTPTQDIGIQQNTSWLDLRELLNTHLDNREGYAFRISLKKATALKKDVVLPAMIKLTFPFLVVGPIASINTILEVYILHFVDEMRWKRSLIVEAMRGTTEWEVFTVKSWHLRLGPNKESSYISWLNCLCRNVLTPFLLRSEYAQGTTLGIRLSFEKLLSKCQEQVLQ